MSIIKSASIFRLCSFSESNRDTGPWSNKMLRKITIEQQGGIFRVHRMPQNLSKHWPLHFHRSIDWMAGYVLHDVQWYLTRCGLLWACFRTFDHRRQKYSWMKETKFQNEAKTSANKSRCLLVDWFRHAQAKEFNKVDTVFSKPSADLQRAANTREKTMALVNMGALHRNLGHIRQAMQYFEKELQIMLKQQVGDKSLEFLEHANLGLCYRDVGEYQKAFRCCG